MTLRFQGLLTAIFCMACVTGLVCKEVFAQKGISVITPMQKLSLLQNNKSLCDEIDLTDEQRRSLAKLDEWHNSEYRRMIIDQPNQGKAKTQRAIVEIGTKIKGELDTILLPSQQKRLDQLWLRFVISADGPSAGLLDSDFSKWMQLSDVQRAKLLELSKQFKSEIAEKTELFEEKRNELRRESLTKLHEVLTAEQRNKIESMVGDIFREIEVPAAADKK